MSGVNQTHGSQSSIPEVSITSVDQKVDDEVHQTSPSERKKREDTFSGLLTQDNAVLAAISKIRDSVIKNADQVYVKAEERQIPRFFINAKVGQATLVSTKDGSLDESDPYNKLVSVICGPQPNFDTALFQEDTKKCFVSDQSRLAVEKLVTYSYKIQKVDLEMNEASSDQKELLKIINRYISNRAWREISGHDNMLFPPDARKKIETYVDSLKGKPRKKESKHIDVTYRRLFLREVEKLFTEEGAAYAHAIVHGITLVADESAKHLKDHWVKFLTQHSALRPSWTDLELQGIIPSLKMKQFKNLFSPLEWKVIEESKILQMESRISNIRKMPLTFDGIKNIFTECRAIKDLIEKNDFFDHYLAIKKERLLICGRLKKTLKKGGKLNMWREVGRDWTSSQQVMNAFGIGRVHSESGLLQGISWQSLNSQLTYDKATDTWVLRDFNSPDLSAPMALQLVSEIMNLINR